MACLAPPALQRARYLAHCETHERQYQAYYERLGEHAFHDTRSKEIKGACLVWKAAMFSTVASGLVMLAERTRDTWPGHAPFVRLHEVVKDMNEDALRDAMDNYLLPVAAQLQKKNLGYFRQDPTFEALDLSNVDLESQPKALEEIFTVLNHTLLLQSTMSLLPDNLLNVAQTMASQMTSVVKPDGSIDPDAMQSILGEAMQAAGLHRQHIADMDPETAQQKLKEARRNLI